MTLAKLPEGDRDSVPLSIYHFGVEKLKRSYGTIGILACLPTMSCAFSCASILCFRCGVYAPPREFGDALELCGVLDVEHVSRAFVRDCIDL